MNIDEYIEDKYRLRAVVAKELNAILRKRGLSEAEDIAYAQKLVDALADLVVVPTTVTVL